MAMGMDPMSAGIGAGAGILQQLMQQKFQAEEARKQREIEALQAEAQAAQGMAAGQGNAFQNLMARYGSLL
jgi:hypothetical protein